jgi:hypothetical protein
MKEADAAAQRRIPVIHQGIEYERIAQVGYEYDKTGQRRGFVQLLDRSGHSVSYADPSRCTLKEATT